MFYDFNCSHLSKSDLVTSYISLHQGQIRCRGAGRIQFLRYEDYKDCGETNDCDIYFKSLVIRDGNDNTLFKIDLTTTTKNTNTVNLTRVEELRDPITIHFPTNKTVTISLKVWDNDHQNSDDFIKSWTNVVVPFSDLEANETARTKISHSPLTSENAYLTFEYSVLSCDDGYTGRGCNYCRDKVHSYFHGSCTCEYTNF